VLAYTGLNLRYPTMAACHRRRVTFRAATVESPRSAAHGQGLTFVNLSAHLEPCLALKNTLHTLNTPLTRDTQPLRAPPPSHTKPSS